MSTLSWVGDFILLFLGSTGSDFASMLEGENGPDERVVDLTCTAGSENIHKKCYH